MKGRNIRGQKLDDQGFGTRDKRGNWAPNDPVTTAPLFVFPPRPVQLLRWLPNYFLPWNLIWALSAVAWWLWVVPSAETMQTLNWAWPLRLLAVNAAAVAIFYGLFEARLYWQRAQANRFKYNGAFPSDKPSDVFWFKSQQIDSLIRTFLSGVPIWTAWQVLALWAWANGWGGWIELVDHPVYLALFALILPILHETHFYLIHRLIHTPFMYKWVHSVHHNSVNPSPWSSLAMHPVEHLMYFSTVLFHFILPSHPLLVIYQLHLAGFGAIVGHIGFDKIEVGPKSAIDSNAYAHYLHHKYFEVNYGDGLIPLDRVFGTWHDGTKAGDEAMKTHYAAKKSKANA